MKELFYLNKFLLKNKFRFLLGIVVAFCSRIFAVTVPKYVANCIADLEQFVQSDRSDIQLTALKSNLFSHILWLIAAAALSGFFMFLVRQCFIVVSRHIEYDLKNEIYDHYQKLSTSFYKQHQIGDLMNRISEDVTKVRLYVGPAIMYSVNTLSLFIIAISYMVSTAPKLALYALAPLPFLSVIVYTLSKIINKRTSKVQESLSELTATAQEIFSGIRVIKAYSKQKFSATIFNSHADDLKNKNIRLTKVQALFMPMMILLIGCSNIVVIYIGGQQYINGEIPNFGILVSFILFINMLTWPVATVGWVSSMVQQADASQKRINTFLKTNAFISFPEDAPKVSLNSQVRFDNVSFTYPESGTQALKNISFTLKKGQTLGIIGHTGSGKTTLLELLVRSYDPTEGQVIIDDHVLDQIDLTTFRKKIAYVPQDAFLFSDTIFNNIAFSLPTADLEAVKKAADAAYVAHDIERFKDGYDTLLGERGVTLSGGQRQRVSIARALLRPSELLLLDDCLSAVDQKSEKQIQSNFKVFPTKVVVSHRVSSVRDADLILVLKQGEIIEQGTHQNLVETGGYYCKLFKKQQNFKEN